MFRQTQDQTERLATGAAWRIWELRPGTEDSQEVGLRRASLVICPEVLRTQSPNSPAERVLHHKQTQVRLRVSQQRPIYGCHQEKDQPAGEAATAMLTLSAS